MNKPKKNGVEYDYSRRVNKPLSEQQLRDIAREELKKQRGNYGPRR